MNYKIKTIYSTLRDFWFPKQRWLTSKIPNCWVDKDTLWEICILEGIRHYVEGEKCFEVLANDPPEQAQFLKEVKEHYRYIIHTLPQLQNELELEWWKISSLHLPFNTIVTREDYERVYGKIDALEKQIFDLKTKIMFWAVLNRNSIWT